MTISAITIVATNLCPVPPKYRSAANTKPAKAAAPNCISGWYSYNTEPGILVTHSVVHGRKPAASNELAMAIVNTAFGHGHAVTIDVFTH